MSEWRLVSADSHINEPPDLWTSRVPAKFVDRAPRQERFEQGDAWVMEGALDPINFGANCNVGLPPEKRPGWIRWEDVRPGGYDPAARVAEQGQDGVDAEILYPTPRVSNQVFWNTADPEFHLACVRAYNDWLSGYASYAPDHLWGVGMLPNVGVPEAVAEVRRIAELPGLRGVVIGQYAHGGEIITRADDPVWAAIEETGMPMSIHVGFALVAQGDKARRTPGGPTGAVRFLDAPGRVAQFIETGVFDRFPDLHLVLVEVDSSWLPYLAEQMNDRFGRAAAASRPDIKRRPSDYFTDCIFSTFITDRYGIKNRHEIGVSQMMWSSDYPHSGADWPNSKRSIEEQFSDVPDDEKEQILAANAVRIYRAR